MCSSSEDPTDDTVSVDAAVLRHYLSSLLLHDQRRRQLARHRHLHLFVWNSELPNHLRPGPVPDVHVLHHHHRESQQDPSKRQDSINR